MMNHYGHEERKGKREFDIRYSIFVIRESGMGHHAMGGEIGDWIVVHRSWLIDEWIVVAGGPFNSHFVSAQGNGMAFSKSMANLCFGIFLTRSTQPLKERRAGVR